MIQVEVFVRGRNGNMTSGTLHVEHMRMEMAKILQEVDRLGARELAWRERDIWYSRALSA